MSDYANCKTIWILAEGSLQFCHGGFELFGKKNKD